MVKLTELQIEARMTMYDEAVAALEVYETETANAADEMEQKYHAAKAIRTMADAWYKRMKR